MNLCTQAFIIPHGKGKFASKNKNPICNSNLNTSKPLECYLEDKIWQSKITCRTIESSMKLFASFFGSRIEMEDKL